MRLLFLLPFAPRADATHGGSRSLAEMLVRVAERHELGLLYLRAADEPPLDELLRDRCALAVEVARPAIRRSWSRRARQTLDLIRGRPMWASDWAVADFARRLRALASSWNPDVVQVEFPVMGQYLTALGGCAAPRVLVDHDPGPAAARELLRTQHGLAWALQWCDVLAWERYERAVIAKVDAAVAVTEADRRTLVPYGSGAHVLHIPVGTVLPNQPLDPLGSSPPSLLFLGSYTHAPNVDAALWLAGRIFPRVLERRPETMLYIVGEQPPAELRALASDHIIVTGRVPDVVPYLDRAALVVVPLRLGGGMRVKMLEALAYGKAIVASRRAIEGLDLVDGEQALLAETEPQFVEAIALVLGDPLIRARLAGRGRAWAHAHLSWEHVIASYEQLYDRLIASPALTAEVDHARRSLA